MMGRKEKVGLLLNMHGNFWYLCYISGVHPVIPRYSITQAFRYQKWRNPEPYFRLFWVWVFPFISRIHAVHIGEDSSILGAFLCLAAQSGMRSWRVPSQCPLPWKQGLYSTWSLVVNNPFIRPFLWGGTVALGRGTRRFITMIPRLSMYGEMFLSLPKIPRFSGFRKQHQSKIDLVRFHYPTY